MRIAIVGTRDTKISFDEWSEYLLGEIKNTDTIVSGGAKGIDTYAANLAKLCGCKLVEFKPEYKRYGRAATIIRNTKIVEESDMVVAFPSDSSKGTYDTIRKAQKAGKQVKVIKI